MKKKRFLRFFSLILCLCFALFSFAGCGNATGGGNIDDGDDSETSEQEPTLLGGVKTLTRPENYDYDAALGDFSENFYNIFAHYISKYLYDTYVLNKFEDESTSEEKKHVLNTENYEGYKSLVVENDVATYPLTDQTKLYYFYDTPRYQITKVTTKKDAANKDIQEIEFSTNLAWNWNIKLNASGYEGLFYDTDTDVVTLDASSNKAIIHIEDAMVGDWSEIVWENEAYGGKTWIERVYHVDSTDKAFSDFFYGNDEVKIEGTTNTDYWKSPAYGNTGLNYYQDALEYAIYMIVLGYDHVNDAAYFDFTISDALKNGEETGASMTVGGWGASKISVEQALANAKERFKLAGNYIGFANKNIDTLTDFIVKKVIGQESKFTININGTPTAFNHNYEAIVHNIIRYACDKAPIGNDKAGNPIHLADTYLTSKITDYEGDYFGIALDFDENGEYDDSNLFSNIEAAEYQSIVFMPQTADVGKKMTDVWLIFEYFDLPDGSAKVMDTENGITLNIGIRYYDSVTQSIYELGETQITIKYAKNGNQATEEDPEGDPLTMLCFGEGDAGVDISFTHTPLIQTPFVSPTEIDAQKAGLPDGSGDFRKSIQMTGANKDYYKLNDSSSYGQYGTLNEAAFVGENACDFVEVYFDIVKDKNTAANKSYSFKVGATIFFEDV